MEAGICEEIDRRSIAGWRNRRTSVDCKDEAWFKQAEDLKLESQELLFGPLSVGFSPEPNVPDGAAVSAAFGKTATGDHGTGSGPSGRSGNGGESEGTELGKTFPLDTMVQRHWLPTTGAAVSF